MLYSSVLLCHMRGWMTSRPRQFNFIFVLRNEIALHSLWLAACFPGCSLRYWRRRVKISRRSSTWLTVPGDPSGTTRKRKGNESAATRQSIPLLIYVSWQLNLTSFLPFPHTSLLLLFFVSRTDLSMSFTSAGIPEANGHSPAHSSTSVTGKSGSGSSVSVTGVTGGGGGAAAVAPAGGAVVDLTLDSSSEEEGGGAGGDSEDTEDSEDSPAPKRGRYNYDKDLVTAYWPRGSVPSKTDTHTERQGADVMRTGTQ